MDRSKLNDLKEDVRNKIDIVTVVERYVGLKSTGENMKGLCPFHKEKTPSFTVNSTKGIYHCFGCGASGDVFSFLMEIESISFMEALKQLADEVGVSLDDIKDSKPEGGTFRVEELHQVNSLALQFFYDSMKSSDEAIDFFKKRGLSAETVRSFRLGFAPDNWTSFRDMAVKKGFSDEVICAAGVGLQSAKGGRVYDRFRRRVIFPIFDTAGRPIAFGGRIIDDSSKEPKYLNSPETPLYKKNRVFYGLDKARQSIRELKSAIIVEGYMDVIMLSQEGVKNVLATCGTALTSEHGYYLNRFTNRVILLFDGDAAGFTAAQRGVENLLPLELDVRVALLPSGDDPDTYISREGRESFQNFIKGAQSGISFLIAYYSKSFDISVPQGKSAALKRLASVVSNIDDQLIKNEYIKEITDFFSIDLKLFNSISSGGSSPEKRVETKREAVSNVVAFDRQMATEEGSLIHALLSFPHLLDIWCPRISPDIFCKAHFSEMFKFIDKYRERTAQEVAQIENRGLQEFFMHMLLRESDIDDPDQWISHKVSRLESTFRERKKQELVKLVAQAHDPEKRKKLLMQLSELVRKG